MTTRLSSVLGHPVLELVSAFYFTRDDKVFGKRCNLGLRVSPLHIDVISEEEIGCLRAKFLQGTAVHEMRRTRSLPRILS